MISKNMELSAFQEMTKILIAKYTANESPSKVFLLDSCFCNFHCSQAERLTISALRTSDGSSRKVSVEGLELP